jgi:hypothetical protein
MLNNDLINKFSDGIRVILVTNRKGNEKFFISRHRQEFEQYIKEEYEKLKDGFRIYSTVNKRNLEKAIRVFKEKQLKADYIEQLKNPFYTRIERYFVSSLMIPSSRDEKQYLIDIDDLGIENEIQTILKNNSVEKIFEYNTVTGKHIIVKPFDARLIKESDKVQIHKDGVILIGWK